MKAMILAAGIGSRLKPLTENKPKALVEVGGMSMLEMTIRFLKKHGINEFVINVHHFADQLIRFLEENKGFGMKFEVSEERDELLNTGGAILHAKKFFDKEGTFVLTGIDVLTNLDLTAMINSHIQEKALVSLAVKDRVTTRSLLFSDSMQLQGWRDNKTGELKGEYANSSKYALGFSAIHVIDSAIFNEISETGAFSIVDLYLRLMESKKIIGFRHDESLWLEFGRANRIPEQEKSKEFIFLRNLL